MNITYLDNSTVYTRLEQNITGNSNAIGFPYRFGTATVLLSSVSGGTALVQYTISSEEQVSDDSATWHNWSVGEVSSEGGIAIDAPITFIRVIAQSGVSYKIEVLA